MKARRFVGIAGTALLVSVTLEMRAAQAVVQPPLSARTYKARLARAMDECAGPFVTVVNPGAVGACPQANTTTDNLITGVIKASVGITSGPGGVKMYIAGSGFTPPGQRVAIQLTFRTTNTQGSPAGSKTYEDRTVICGSTAGYTCGHFFPGDVFGKIHGRMSLAQCLTDNGVSTTLATGNIELLDVALINCDTGKVVAVPGLVK